MVGIMAAAVLAAAVCSGVPDPIIDVHVHSYEQDARLRERVPDPATGAPQRLASGIEHAKATAAALRAAGVVRAIIGGETHATDARLVRLDPERLRFGFKVDRLPMAADLAQIRALHAAGQLAMIGEVDYQYEGIRQDDPGLEPLWAIAEELQVPIAMHSGAGPAGIAYMGSPNHRER